MNLYQGYVSIYPSMAILAKLPWYVTWKYREDLVYIDHLEVVTWKYIETLIILKLSPLLIKPENQ